MKKTDELIEYDGKYVKLWTKNGSYYEGICTHGTDYETEEDYLDFVENNLIYEVMASEIERIEVIK